MLHVDPSKMQSNHKRNDARTDNEAFTDPKRAVDKDKGESARLVLHCDAEGPGKKALLTQGTMNVADKGKVAAVTTVRQTVEQQTAKEMLTCVQACRHLPACDRHGKERRSRPVFASEEQDRTQVEESPERRAASASSMWRQQRRTRRTSAERTDRSESTI